MTTTSPTPASGPTDVPTNPPADREKLRTPRRTLDSAVHPAGVHKWVVLAILACGVFMSTLDSSIVNISLPTIARAFGVPLSGAIEWVVIAYLVIIAAVLLTMGRLADMLGRKSLWIVGLVLFTIGSAICGLAPSLGFLIAARALQGLGGALLFAVSPAMLTSAFPARERGLALGSNAVIVALGVSVGPTLGGIITQTLTWHWIFYVNIPIGIIAVLLSFFILRERRNASQPRFDPLGALLLALGLGLSFGQEWGWTSLGLVGLLTGAIVMLVFFAIVEAIVPHPIVDLALFRNRLFASANISLVISFLALFAVSFLLPFYYEDLRGYDTLTSGLLLTPLPLTIAAVAPISGRLADRIGTRWLAASGLAIACIGLLLLSTIGAQTSLLGLIVRLVIVGLGQALFQSPNNSALMGAAPAGQQGIASGMLATGRVVGQSLSVAVTGAIFASLGGAAAGQQLVQARATHTPVDSAALSATFVTSIHLAFVVCAIIAALGVVTSLVRGNERR